MITVASRSTCEWETSSPGPSPLSRWRVGAKKTLANSRSRVSKNIGDFDCFKMAVGSRLVNFVVTNFVDEVGEWVFLDGS